MDDSVGRAARAPRLTVDWGARLVLLDGAPVSLTRTQFDVLHALVTHEGRVMTRAQIMEAVWGHSFFSDPDHLSVHIHHIRRALRDTGDEPVFIRTIRGLGYMFVPRDPQRTRRVTLEYDRGSTLIRIHPHEEFLGWDPQRIIGGYFSLAGLSLEATEVVLASMLDGSSTIDRIEGPMTARCSDGSTVEVYVVITPTDAGGYVGVVTFSDGAPD
jgi:DNA-binding winged helix-turn-helix (wHTH) protein